MLQVAEESKRLSDPLQRAQEELRSLQNDLRDADKDRQSLRYAKARLKVRVLRPRNRSRQLARCCPRPPLQTLRTQTEEVQRAHALLEAQYAEAQLERDALYSRFEETVYAAQARRPRCTPRLWRSCRHCCCSFAPARVHPQARAEAKNEVLERKLAEAEAEFVTKKTQIEEVRRGGG